MLDQEVTSLNFSSVELGNDYVVGDEKSPGNVEKETFLEKLSTLNDINDKRNRLPTDLTLMEKDRFEDSFNKALNSFNSLRKHIFGEDNFTFLHNIKEGNFDAEKSNHLSFLRSKVPEKFEVENIDNIQNLLDFQEYLKNYRERRDIYRQDVIDLDFSTEGISSFGFYPEYICAFGYREGEVNKVIDPYLYDRSIDYSIGEIFNINIYDLADKNKINHELLIDTYNRVNSAGRSELADLMMERYEDYVRVSEALDGGKGETPIYYRFGFYDYSVETGDLNKEDLDKGINELTNLISLAIHSTIKNNERSTASKLVRFLGEQQQLEVIENMIVDPKFSAQERINYCAEVINAYGFMPGIESIVKSYYREDISDEMKDELKWVFTELQGSEDVGEIQKRLSDVYRSVNFHEYALNSLELTKYEVSLVMEQIRIFAEQSGIDSSEVVVLDIGAGTGRHSILLTEMGQNRVVAFEREHHHVDKIRKQAEDESLKLKVIEGDWNLLNDKLQESDVNSVDVALCLNRTIMHNRSPDSMLHWWDQLRKSLSNNNSGVNPRVLIDIPNIVEGRYLEETMKIRNSLNKYGVKDFVTLHLFDGPDTEHKFNRLALTEEQFRTYSMLFGFNVLSKITKRLEDIVNDYYVLEYNPKFSLKNMEYNEMKRHLDTLGVSGLGINWDMMVESWGCTIKESTDWGRLYVIWSKKEEKKSESVSTIVWKPSPYYLTPKQEETKPS